jgi:hypothetical protein
MNRDKLNLALGGIAWIIFTWIGHTYATRIGLGFPTGADYAFFTFAVVMFIATWFMVLLSAKHIVIERSK